MAADRDQLLEQMRCPASVDKEGMPSDEVRGFDVFSEGDHADHFWSGGFKWTFNS